MPSFPSAQIGADKVKMRFLEPSVPTSLNARWNGLPRGVWIGFVPQTTPGSDVLTLARDAIHGFSCLKVTAPTSAVMVDIFTADDITLDFSGHTRFPVFVLARADYNTTQHTQGRIFTRTAGPVGPSEITICVVDKPGADLIATTTIPADRQPPLAFDGQAFGYMLQGASDDIALALSVTTEVITARDDIKNPGPPPPGQLLADRLAIDLAADFLASQLGLRNVSVPGNAKIVAAAVTSANVSASFAALHREFDPKIDFTPGGDESTQGVITDPPDSDRNVLFVYDDTTGARVIDTVRQPVYARLSFATAALTGTLQLTQADTKIFGIGTSFDVELEEGDIILGADGKFYEVDTIVGPSELDLSIAYQGASVGAPGVASSYRRWTASFFTRASGAELSVALPSTVNMRIVFSAFVDADFPVFDATAFMKKDGERPVLPEASDVVRGRIKLAVAGGQAGAVHTITAASAPIPNSPNFHTINFDAVNASVVNAGGGVANIIVPGNPGPPGPGASPGPTGPPGPPGFGLVNKNTFETSGSLGPGGSHSHTVVFTSATPPLSGTLAHVAGGFGRFESGNYGGSSVSSFNITNISKAGNSGTIQVSLGIVAISELFLSASI